MSGLLMGRAFYFEVPTRLKLLLLAIADHANDDGYGAHPGQERLARKAGCSIRHIKRLLGELESLGLIEITARGNGAGHSTRYYLPWAVEASVSIPEKGDISAQKGDIAMSPDPSLEPSLREEEEVTREIELLFSLYSSPPKGCRSPLLSPGPYLRQCREKGDLPAGFDHSACSLVAELVTFAAQDGFLSSDRERLPTPELPYPPDLVGLARVAPALLASDVRGSRLRRRLAGFCQEVLGEEYQAKTILTRLAQHPDEFTQFLAAGAYVT